MASPSLRAICIPRSAFTFRRLSLSLGARPSSFHTSRPLMSSNTNTNTNTGPGLPPFDPAHAHSVTQPPDPRWTFGDGMKLSEQDGSEMRKAWAEDAERGWRAFDLDSMDKSAAYRLLTSAVVPRPIAFVSTLSSSSTGAVRNLAPFSYFSLVGHDPPLLTVACTLSTVPGARKKDTRENVLATRELVVNIISEPFVEAANTCSVEAPADVDEWVLSGLTPVPSDVVRPPRVRESAVSFECELYTHIDIPSAASLNSGATDAPPATTLLVARVRRMHVRHAVLRTVGAEAEAEPAEPAEVDPTALRAVSRLGGVRFARIGSGFDILRPRWKDVESVVEELGARNLEGVGKVSEGGGSKM